MMGNKARRNRKEYREDLEVDYCKDTLNFALVFIIIVLAIGVAALILFACGVLK